MIEKVAVHESMFNDLQVPMMTIFVAVSIGIGLRQLTYFHGQLRACFCEKQPCPFGDSGAVPGGDDGLGSTVSRFTGMFHMDVD